MLGNVILDRIFVGICLLISISVSGFFIYTEMMYKKKLPEEKVEAQALKDDSKKVIVPKGHTIKKVVVNLPTEGSRLRFLNLAILFIPFSEAQIPYLEKNNDALMDIILHTATEISAQDLNSITGKILLEDRLKKNIHKKLGDELVKEIFFTNYVVQ